MAERKRIPAKAAQKKNTGNAREISAVILIVLGIVSALCAYTNAKEAPLGRLITNIGTGLVGSVAFALPIYLLVLGIHMLAKRNFTPYRRNYIWAAIILVELAAFLHLIIGYPEWDFGLLASSARGGGILGGVIATALYKLAGSVVAGVLLGVALIASVFAFTGTGIGDIAEALRGRNADREEERAARRTAEKPAEKPVKQKKEPQAEKPAVREKVVSDEKDEPPFDFDKIKVYTSDQLSVDDMPKEPVSPIAAPAAETPGDTGGKEDPGPPVAVSEIEKEISEAKEERIYTYPSLELLERPRPSKGDTPEELRENAKKLVDTLKSFGVDAKILEVTRGPSVTRYELQPGAGVKVSKIANLADDIALNLAATGVRIEAPIPGKAAVGIEIPNRNNDMVTLREVLESSEFQDFGAKTAFALGKDIMGKTHVANIAKMPHLLIAGATGSGKSVCINTLITSIIYKAAPEDVRLVMIDPKVVELGIYNGIPHLLIPVVTDPRKAAGALNWGVQEMLRRYKLFAECNVRNLSGYNEYAEGEGEKKMESIIVIIDELADLMMAAPHEVEDAICRIAQMGRAAGIHLVIATQRPSVDVITGLIKANVPSRIALAVSNQIDSRTILDMMGAEKLLGKGDMLYLPFGASKPVRLQGAFVSDREVENIVEFVKGDAEAEYDEEILERIERNEKPESEEDDPGDSDALLKEAIEVVVENGEASVSMIQRRLKVGYSRAGRIIDQMEARGIIGPKEGSKPRQVMITKQQFYEMSVQSADE